jgi:hypothetical protein
MTSKGPDWLIVAARRKYLALTRTRLSAAVALLAPALLVTCGSLPTSWCAERVSRYSEKKTPKAMSSQISTPE